jgi:hypothetical protein
MAMIIFQLEGMVQTYYPIGILMKTALRTREDLTAICTVISHSGRTIIIVSVRVAFVAIWAGVPQSKQGMMYVRTAVEVKISMSNGPSTTKKVIGMNQGITRIARVMVDGVLLPLAMSAMLAVTGRIKDPMTMTTEVLTAGTIQEADR